MERNSLSAVELGKLTNASHEGIRILLSTLESYGYVRRKRGDKYQNSPMTSKWLVNSSQHCLANYISMWHELAFKFWDEYFEKTIIDGTPSVSFYQWISKQDPSVSKTFQRAMMETARLFINDVVGKIKVPQSSRKLLDVGGGHGLYAIRLCQMNHQLSATIIDSASPLETAKENVEAGKMSERIVLDKADYLAGELGIGYDLALVFNVIHSHTPRQNIDLLKNVASALSKNGRIYILSLTSDKGPSKTSEVLTKLSQLLFFTSFGGNVYQASDVTNWLEQVGFVKVQSFGFQKFPGLKLFVGQKKP